MATTRELAASVLSALALVQNADEDLLDTSGVHEMLLDMDQLADELREVLG